MVVKDESSPWIHMDISYWEDLLSAQIPRLYRKKTFLFQHGDKPEHVFIIKSGRVRITSYCIDGNEKQLYIGEAGSICGEIDCIQNHPYNASAIAIVDSEIFCLPYKVLENQMRNNWSLTKKLMQVICQKNLIFMEQIMELSFDQSKQRVARILLNIAAEYGQDLPDGSVRIGIKFTHQDIATMINTSRVTTNNVINSFSEEGIIIKEGGYYILKDIVGLNDYILNDG
ncbi:MAG: Crp/Fnr family transcriptional regulator [Spirochaetes bacterium]|nr:Crp/Fnr family transcriptional regulator [Spirochaetota bacterium]